MNGQKVRGSEATRLLSTPGSTGDKLFDVSLKLDATKAIMQDNIELVIEREESLENLADKSDNLRTSSKIYYDGARDARRALCLRNAKQNCVLIVLIIGIIGVVALLIYFASR